MPIAHEVLTCWLSAPMLLKLVTLRRPFWAICARLMPSK